MVGSHCSGAGRWPSRCDGGQMGVGMVVSCPSYPEWLFHGRMLMAWAAVVYGASGSKGEGESSPGDVMARVEEGVEACGSGCLTGSC